MVENQMRSGVTKEELLSQLEQRLINRKCHTHGEIVRNYVILNEPDITFDLYARIGQNHHHLYIVREKVSREVVDEAKRIFRRFKNYFDNPEYDVECSLITPGYGGTLQWGIINVED